VLGRAEGIGKDRGGRGLGREMSGAGQDELTAVSAELQRGARVHSLSGVSRGGGVGRRGGIGSGCQVGHHTEGRERERRSWAGVERGSLVGHRHGRRVADLVISSLVTEMTTRATA
jgi:hypothetical protein